MSEGAPAQPAADLAPPARIRPWESLTYRDYRVFWLGYPLNSIGTLMRSTTNAFQVYQITGSTSLLGLTFLFQGLPAIVMGVFGGSLADIFPKRHLLRVALVFDMALAAALAALTFSGRIEVWHIYGLTFLSSSVGSMKGPASQAMVPKLVPTRLLLNATALYSVTFNVAMFGGPMLSGLMIDTIGAGWSYVVNGALAVPAIVSVTMLRFSDAGQRGKVRLNVAYLFEGLTFAVQTRVLAAFIMLDTVAMVFGYYPALMPVFAGDILDSGGIGLGLLLGAAPVGALLGLLAILVLGDIHRKGLLILAVTIAHGAVLVAFAASSWFILSLLLVGVLGLLDSVSVSVRNTSFQLLATDANRGRVASLVGIAANASNSLGGAYLGLAASLMGPQRALAVGGIVGAAFSGLVAAGLPQVRRFRA